MEDKRRSAGEEEDADSKIPDDVTIEIISRLPAKDLMRFTCVSKSWLSLIATNSHLSTLQHRRAASSDPPLVLLQRVLDHVPLHNTDVSSCECYVDYRFRLDSLQDRNVGREEIQNPFEDGRDAHIAASCDGLLVLQQSDTRALALSNPTTGKYQLVPPNPAGDEKVAFSGFGCDKDHSRYKLVTVIESDEDANVLQLMIYDVNVDATWRKVEFEFERLFWSRDMGIFDYLMNYSGCYANGDLYWKIDLEDDSVMIIGFDLEEEEFFDAGLPKFGYVLYEGIKMVTFDGKLCLVCDLERMDDSWSKERVDVWVRNDTLCWIKLFSISNFEKLEMISRDYFHMLPMCYSACRNKVLFDFHGINLVWYNIGTKDFEEFNSPLGKTSWCGVITCVRSLLGNGIF